MLATNDGDIAVVQGIVVQVARGLKEIFEVSHGQFEILAHAISISKNGVLGRVKAFIANTLEKVADLVVLGEGVNPSLFASSTGSKGRSGVMQLDVSHGIIIEVKITLLAVVLEGCH